MGCEEYSGDKQILLQSSGPLGEAHILILQDLLRREIIPSGKILFHFSVFFSSFCYLLIDTAAESNKLFCAIIFIPLSWCVLV